MEEIGPQPGPQTQFLSTPADIAIFGGSAGGGKSYAMLLEPIRHVQKQLPVPFDGVVFRQQSVQITNPGGLWSQSYRIYPFLGAEPNNTVLRWTFPTKATISFKYISNDGDLMAWMGSELAFIGFDELTHFQENQFFYMLSRNRSMSGIRPYVRATCNPDPDSFVAKLIDWWIDQDTGLSIPERSGVLRWFLQVGEERIWRDTKAELVALYGEEAEKNAKSFTFIRSSIYDNRKLLERDPGYIANLKSLNRVDRARLLDGNWKVRFVNGDFFQRSWFGIVDLAPVGSRVRWWDRASTTPSEQNRDPDWTVGVKACRSKSGEFFIEDVVRFRCGPGEVKERILNTATQDGPSVVVGLSKDPAQAGVFEINEYMRTLAGFTVRAIPETGDKGTRAGPVSSQARHGNVKLVRGRWNEAFLNELENFNPDNQIAHDDQVDAFAGAYNFLANQTRVIVV